MGPYVGEPTENVQDMLCSGICGQRPRRRVYFHPDVSQETTIFRAARVQSQRSYNLIVDETVIGELDLQSFSKTVSMILIGNF
jgi:putative methionine-R-sulfoxide reductase with GAF domain